MRPLEEYLIVDLDDLLCPPVADTDLYWDLSQQTAAIMSEKQGKPIVAERVRITSPNWSMDWLGIGIIEQEKIA